MGGKLPKKGKKEIRDKKLKSIFFIKGGGGGSPKKNLPHILKIQKKNSFL